MSKNKTPSKNEQDKALNRRNLIIASIVGMTVILTFLIELPQKINATIEVFRATETLTPLNTPDILSTTPSSATLEMQNAIHVETLTPETTITPQPINGMAKIPEGYFKRGSSPAELDLLWTYCIDFASKSIGFEKPDVYCSRINFTDEIPQTEIYLDTFLLMFMR